MQTDAVILSAKYDHYSIPVPPGEYVGFFLYRRGNPTLTQTLHIGGCGFLTLRSGAGVVYMEIPLRFVPSSDFLRASNFNRYNVKPDDGWKIDLQFRDRPTGHDEEGNPTEFLRWEKFPGEAEIGFVFVGKEQ
jgi:hypothetical protein